jgi:glycosyltransferase involved in cell wall biosynthesis
MKLLYILNLTSRVNSFSMSSLLAAKDLGIDFHIAGNWSYSNKADRINDELRLGIHIYQIDFRRNPLHPLNVRAYRQLSRIARKENFDVIHCNTPIGGLVGRIIGHRCKVKEIIYQAHGFHFYKGASILNWLLYYPAEKWMARYTDDLICINQEDYKFAKQNFNLRHTGRIHYVPGIGIDTKKYEAIHVDRDAKRRELGLPTDLPLVLSVGELNCNKNHATVIRALTKLPQLHYAIAGRGPLQQELAAIAERLGVSDRVHFLGFRTDLAEIYSIADVFCLPSKREGLSTAIMEAMASGLPIVCSDIRGNRDLVVQNKGGRLVETMDKSSYATAIRDLIDDPQLRSVMAHFNTEHIKDFCLERVIDMMQVVYREALDVL